MIFLDVLFVWWQECFELLDWTGRALKEELHGLCFLALLCLGQSLGMVARGWCSASIVQPRFSILMGVNLGRSSGFCL